MADSIPSLRKKLDAANAEIDLLRASMREPQARTIYQDRIIEVPVAVYVDNPDHIATINALKERVCQLESFAQAEPVEEK